MQSRSAELRERYRRVLRWSFGIAVLLHIGFFAFWSNFRVEPIAGWDKDVPLRNVGEGRPVYVEVVFGPPEISLSDGGVFVEERELQASRVLLLPAECGVLDDTGAAEPEGRVHLRVWESGHADVVEIAKGTGSECGDEMITAMAGALRYRWLPNERFPAPVDLIQPVTLMPTAESP